MGVGSDQLVGRAVAGLPINTIDFGTLPPHFATNDLDLLRSLGWADILNGYDNLPLSFKTLIPQLLASVMYHQGFLRHHLPGTHSLFRSAIYTREFVIHGRRTTIMDCFNNRKLTGTMLCKGTSMQATGIPPHLTLLERVESLERDIANLKLHVDG